MKEWREIMGITWVENIKMLTKRNLLEFWVLLQPRYLQQVNDSDE